jgi:hypothetical protein
MALLADWKKFAVAAALAAGSLALTGPVAQAFFPPWWPTDTIGKRQSPEDPIYVPPVPNPHDPIPTDPVPPTDPPPPPGPCPDPNCVPEPSTLSGGLAGLLVAAWATRRGWRR